MCPKLRHIYYTDVASGACECSTPSDATCWGSTPNPSEHDSHAAVRVCFVNIAQNSRVLCVRSMGLGCCPTSRSLDLAIQRHCLPRHVLCFHRRMHCLASEDYVIFESALPCTGWTVLLIQSTTPSGVGHGFLGAVDQGVVISIHPPRAGWDLHACGGARHDDHFNPPTPSGVGLHHAHAGRGAREQISIHPPRAGWDCITRDSSTALDHFNPPTPSGVGRDQRQGGQDQKHFNPLTPSGVGPTVAPH